jgi:asparagine synthetase B (glutamine-hydrolysing)
MCGISGWRLAAKPGSEFALAMAYGILDRGYDSWGYFDGETIRKEVGTIAEGIRAADMCAPSAFVHTRHATTGEVKKSNAHPFAVGDIIGAHNGVIYNHDAIQKTHGRSLAVDSQHIFQNIVEGKPLTELEGYGAIEFVRQGQWFVGACNFGDLAVAKLKNDAGVIWASTKDCLGAAIFQGGFELEHFYTIEQGKIYRVEVDSLYETDQVFNLAKRPLDILPSTGKGHYWDWKDSKDRQENWYRDSSLTQSTIAGPDSDVPSSFFDECEFCGNPEFELMDYYDSLICEACAEILNIRFQPTTDGSAERDEDEADLLSVTREEREDCDDIN